MTSFQKEFEIKLNLHIEILHYRPGRGAPACSNPEHPAFSDPGDDVELEFQICLLNKKNEKRELPKELDFLYYQLFDEILEDLENDFT